MALSKDELRERFSKDYKNYYYVKLFEEEGFTRKKCTKCSKNFWTADTKRTLCGDSTHEPYTFIKKTARNVDYVPFWEKFADFFRENGHTAIGKYPVVSRWRPDLYFTIASIQDFQRIENGNMSFDYSANPLVVPQICMRFNDIPNVGITGRHFTSFMMAGQHSFNYPKEGYWRDKTIELNYKFLTKVLGVKKKDLTYTEDVWAMGDFSEFGPCLESFANGLELVNSVFTQFEYVDGKIRELPSKVVDVGWGFERLMWYYSGEQTAYDAVFRKELEYMYEKTGIKYDKKLYGKVAGRLGEIDITEKHDKNVEENILKLCGITAKEFNTVIKPMQAIYAIADHSRSLLFAINDGALPSNVGGGYNLRIILRRMLEFVERYGLKLDLMELMEIEVSNLKGLYPDIDSNMADIRRILEVETQRYNSSKESAHRIVDSLLKEKKKPDAKMLKMLYESNGITPEFITSIAASKGIDIDVDEDAYSNIVKGDFSEKKEPEKPLLDNMLDLPKTKKAYYDFVERCDAVVLYAKDNLVVLDKTPFYPEGGGQEADRGTINGIKVSDVQSANGVAVHIMSSKTDLKKDDDVECIVDRERRIRIMAHHTATHLISAAARKYLGQHAWQEGAHKAEDKAHIDIAHYERLDDGQVIAIERVANNFITHGIKVIVEDMPRAKAEREFGFSIYQGHGAPTATLRMVKIYDLEGNLIDAEACGGLHIMGRESVIGLIKIISSYRIHDGIDRLEYIAGPVAAEYLKMSEARMTKIAKMANVNVKDLDKGIEKSLTELQAYKKRTADIEERLSDAIAFEIKENSHTKEIIKELNEERLILRKVATKVAAGKPDSVILLYNPKGEVVSIAGNKSKTGALDFAKKCVPKIKSGAKLVGGGSEKIAEGRIG
jgi:alanyl-tRNA synthetase